MSKAAQELLDSVLKLSDEEKDQVIAGLLESVEITDEEDDDFRDLLDKRIEEVESGMVKTIPWQIGRQMIVDDKDVIPH